MEREEVSAGRRVLNKVSENHSFFRNQGEFRAVEEYSFTFRSLVCVCVWKGGGYDQGW